MIVLLLTTATLGTTAFATTTTASAGVGDEHWFSHGGAIAASNYARKQLDIDIPWPYWQMDCELTKRVKNRERAKCSTETTRTPCEGEQCGGRGDVPEAVKKFRCEGTLRVRHRNFNGGVDAYDRRIDCQRR
jgi:hypothetical protein